MSEMKLFLPSAAAPARSDAVRFPDKATVSRLLDHLDAIADAARAVWADAGASRVPRARAEAAEAASQILRLLTSRPFNSQGKARIAETLPMALQRLRRHTERRQPIPLYLLFNGGYRASPFGPDGNLIYSPDHTELMLLHQIGRLRAAAAGIYEPGVEFHIVINNGVAEWVNDIPLERTEDYVRELRMMILHLGAAGTVRVLVQSELPPSTPSAVPPPCDAGESLEPKSHAMVERFLGRRCGAAEARARMARYEAAERTWFAALSQLTEGQEVVFLRQVPHHGMLSFRPFPGGAIRVQNGTLGFIAGDGPLRPKLVTSESFLKHQVEVFPFHLRQLPAWQSSIPLDSDA